VLPGEVTIILNSDQYRLRCEGVKVGADFSLDLLYVYRFDYDNFNKNVEVVGCYLI
jgi:hypothetical protein